MRKDIEAYLPIRKVKRQWSDRKKIVEEPLIRGYLFVRIDTRDYYDVLVVPGALSFVKFDNQLAAIPDYQINDIKIFLENDVPDLEVTNERMQKGQLVKICDGPFDGFIGEVSELRGKKRILIRIRQLGCIVHADLVSSQVQVLNEAEVKQLGSQQMIA